MANGTTGLGFRAPVLISDTVNINRYNPQKQKLFGIPNIY